MCRSVPQIATESTLHRTSNGPGWGVGTSRISWLFGAVSTTARIRSGIDSMLIPPATWTGSVAHLCLCARHDSGRGGAGVPLPGLRAGWLGSLDTGLFHIQEGYDTADTALTADPTPGNGAHGAAPAGHFRDFPAQVLDHAHVVARGRVVHVLEVGLGYELVHGSAVHLFKFFDQVGPHPAYANVHGMVHRRQVTA